MDALNRVAFALECLMKEMVEEPALLRMVVVASLDGPVVFRVSVAPADLGRLIGVQGRTARSLRIILGSLSTKVGRKLSLDLLEGLPPSA